MHMLLHTTKNLVIKIFQCLTLVIGLATDFLNQSLSRLLNDFVIDLEIHLKIFVKPLVKLVTISHITVFCSDICSNNVNII